MFLRKIIQGLPAALVFWGLCVLILAPAVQSVPSGFSDDMVVDINKPTGFDFITYQNGTYQMLVIQREGYVYLVDDLETVPRQKLVLDITDRVCDNGSRGLLTVLVHPNFQSNRWVYLYYTLLPKGDCESVDLATGPINRVARYEMSALDGSINVTTEHILLETSRTENLSHNGGDMKFGKDGFLYITLGDGGYKPNAQDKSTVLGSLIRLTEDGGIPPGGNAYTAADGYSNVVRCNVMGSPPSGTGPDPVCAEIWAIGLRNPFRFAMDPNAAETRLFIADVGGSDFEELSEAGTNFRGANYGWPIREGPWSRLGDSCDPIPEYVDPVYWYRHSPAFDGGGAVLGGAFVPNGIWPSEFNGLFIFPDYVFNALFILTPRTPVRIGCTENWVPAYSNATFHPWERVTGLLFGPYNSTQALYYATRTDTSLRGLRRISRTSTTVVPVVNRAPVPLITSNASYAEVNETIAFDASASFDPEGDELRYKFKINREAATSWLRSPIYERSFTTIGRQRIRLKCQDRPVGKSSMSSLWVEMFVEIGPMPFANMTSPEEGALFSVGQALTLSAIARTTVGDPLPNSNMSWEIRLGHNVHYHEFVTRTGNSVTIPGAPGPEELAATTNSHLEVILSVEDPVSGFVRVIRRKVMPRLVTITINSVPPGLTLYVFDEEVVTPANVILWENQAVSLEAPQNSGYAFDRWLHGGNAAQTITISASGTLSYTAMYN